MKLKAYLNMKILKFMIKIIIKIFDRTQKNKIIYNYYFKKSIKIFRSISSAIEK